MVCIYCGGKTNTVNSRKRMHGLSTWRRRRCLDCEAVFTTEETINLEQSLRVKRASSPLEPFLYEKLYLDVYNAVSHRKTAHTDAKGLSATIVSKLIPCKNGILHSSEIKTASSEVLKRFDNAAATYYEARHNR